MHIPDGYLSPATCAALFGGSAPFWYVALKRLKRALHTRVAPLLSLFSAFSFIVMMFNVPLPGGTTGHALGVTIAAIVLGPWGAMISVSVALVIQAILFGDGGITAIGANCFNMAILGSLVAYGVYTALSGDAPIRSVRRVFAAGAAGYLSINVCALAAAIELGIQPLLFHDAGGAPLYAPYPLQIAIPAMMIGHLTIAGLAELVVSAGVVGYLQRTEPSLLKVRAEVPEQLGHAKPLWIAVAALLILTPLGIRFARPAWGEWTPQDFRNSEARSHIAASSLNSAAPTEAPRGLRQLANIWTPPLPHYTPRFLPSASVGYLWSAAAGAGFIILTFGIVTVGFGPKRRDFVGATLASLASTIEFSGHAEQLADRAHTLQQVDPRVKIAGVIAIIGAVVASRNLAPIACVLIAATAFGAASGIALRRLAVWVWLPVLLFSGAIAIPALFLTEAGLRSALFLVLRSETAATLSAVLVLTTPWPHLLKALQTFRVPALVVMMLGMTYRYVFAILRTTLDMFESRRSRTVGVLTPRERRQVAAASAGVLLSRSLQMSGEVHDAMLSRGFRGDVRTLQEFKMATADWCWLAAFLSVAFAAVWAGR